MRKLMAFLLAASSVSVCGASAAESAAATDIPGWHGTKWGMTVDEAKAVLGDEAESVSAEESATKGWNAGLDRSWPTRLRIPNYEIGGHAFDVQLVFEADRLRLVSLVPVEEGTVLGGISVILESQLVEKYGAPRMRKTVGSNKRILWTLGETMIDILYSQFGTDAVLIFTYRAAPDGRRPVMSVTEGP